MNNQMTIKISTRAYERLKAQKANSGASIRFMIDLALDCWLGKRKNANPKKRKLSS